MESEAILIRRIGSNGSKLIALDKEKGMIELYSFKSHQLVVGCLFLYRIQMKYNRMWLDHCSIEYVPLDCARSDILFLHHIFEIIYFFVPVGSCTQYLFDLIKELYNNCPETLFKNGDSKRFFLIKLFLTCGVYHEQNKSLQLFLYQIASTPIDRFCNNSLDLARKQEIDRWLLQCVESHPASTLFKTAHFLKTY
jgi:hypothetical protein